MDLRIIFIIAFSYLYVIFEVIMSRMGKRNRSVKKSGDRGSIWVIMASIFLGYALAFSFARHTLGRIYPWNTCFAIGIILIVIGLYIRIGAILALKQQFTYTVTTMEKHELVETGWYKQIRHPGYLGQLVIFLGITTAMSNWLSILGMMIPVVAGFLYRIRVEERYMQETMGQPYLDYQRRTKRLIMGVY